MTPDSQAQGQTPSQTPSHSYLHRFRSGLVAKMTIGPDGFAVEWQGKPDKSIIPEYLRWRDTILRELSERTGLRMLCITL